MMGSPYPWQLELWQRLLVQLQGNRLAHAYLLVGARGLGKADFANAAAGMLLCEKPDFRQLSACGQCKSCVLFTAGHHPDLLLIEPEGSQVIKIGQVRELAEFAGKTSHGKGRKVIILQNADALNINAANALLKTLEEPPGNTVLLLVTSNPGKLLPTIRSRCQRILFPVPDIEVASDWLRGQAGVQNDPAELLAQANCRPLLALDLLDGEASEERSNILKAFAAIQAGKLDPVEFSGHGKTLGAEKILELLWYLTLELIKQLVVENPAAKPGREALAILQNLAQSSRTADEILGRLLGMNQSVDEARKQLAGPSNPNPQLILEGILWRWSRLAT